MHMRLYPKNCAIVRLELVLHNSPFPPLKKNRWGTSRCWISRDSYISYKSRKDRSYAWECIEIDRVEAVSTIRGAPYPV